MSATSALSLPLSASSRRSVAFVTFQLLTATLFLRPAELFEVFDGWQIYESLIITTLILSAIELEPHFLRYPVLQRQPITLCAVGVFAAVILSHVTHLYLGGAMESGELFLKTLLYYGLLVTTVNTPTRLQHFLSNVAFCTFLMVTICLLDYWEVIELEFVVHMQEIDEIDENGELQFRSRMRGTGIFQDPNDISTVMIAAGILSLYFLNRRENGMLRFFWILPLIVFPIAILETKSRGGFLAACVAGMVWCSLVYGRYIAVTMAAIGGAVLPFIAGRASQIEFGEHSSSTERIEMWREGFEALKSSSILFGIGQGLYGDIAGLVAHNSYIHAYVELGLFGGTLFFGCFYFAIVQLLLAARRLEEIRIRSLVDSHPYIAAVLAGWMTSIFSLSRCYVLTTFLILGICAAYANLVWIHTINPRPLICWSWREASRLCGFSLLFFCGLYVFTRLMG